MHILHYPPTETNQLNSEIRQTLNSEIKNSLKKNVKKNNMDLKKTSQLYAARMQSITVGAKKPFRWLLINENNPIKINT